MFKKMVYKVKQNILIIFNSSERMKIRYLTLVLVFLTGLIAHSQNGVIKGRVFNASNNESLPFTNLIIYGTGSGTTSDEKGMFQFTNIQHGYYKLAASALGFENALTEEFHVSSGKTAFIDIPMKEKSISLTQVEIKSSSISRLEESPVSLKSIGIAQIEKSPGSNRDISKVIQNLPGVSSGLSYRNDLIVRGGGPAENRFLVDGIEIPNLNHFGTQGASGGSVGIINSDFLREVNLFTGAFPANRGNVMSSVLDMKLIDGNPDKPLYRAALGASELSLSSSGPLSPKTSLLVSVRRSYLKFLFDVLKLPFLPTFNDYLIKTKTRFNTKNELTFLSIGSLDKSVLNTGLSNPTEEQQYILSYLPSYDQWTYAIGAVYRHYGQRSYHTLVLSRNMLHNESNKFENNDKNASPLLKYVSRESENKFRYENTARMNGFKIISGFGVETSKYTNNTFQKVFIPTETDTISTLDYQSKLDFYKYNFFGQVSKTYNDGKLTLSAGIRADANTYDREMSNPLDQFSPRASVSYGISKKLFINANTGRYFQLPSYTTLGYRDPSGNLVNKDNGVRYIQADHFVMGLEYRRTENSSISLEGFYKNYRYYPFSLRDSVSIASKGANYGIYGDEPATSTSKGRAYGAELYFKDRLGERFNLQLSYTYVISEFEDSKEVLIPSAWDNRHILNLTFSASLERSWNMGFRWRFVGGAPYTPYDENRSSLIEAWDARGQAYFDYSRFNTQRLTNFHQLDLRIDKEYFFKKWSLNLYLDVQNAYSFKYKDPDVLIVQRDSNGNPIVDPDEPGRYLMKYLPSSSGTVLPTLGVIVEF